MCNRKVNFAVRGASRVDSVDENRNSPPLRKLALSSVEARRVVLLCNLVKVLNLRKVL